MTRNQKIVYAILMGLSVHALLKMLATVHQTNDEVAKIKADTNAEIKRIHAARDAVLRGITQGKYHSLEEVDNDFEFQKIIYHF